MADLGSSINLLDERDFKKLKPRPKLERTNAKVYPYKSDTTLPILGKFKATLETGNARNTTTTFYVTEGNDRSRLSWRTSEDLELIKVARPINSPTAADDEVAKLDLFHGLSRLK